MCWNQSVSLNTFLFSNFVLLLIIYNNSYTKYKIPSLNNWLTYIFIESIILMQLIEFFIWRNIDNRYYNRVFSGLACFLLFIQPIISIMIIHKKLLRNILLLVYLLMSLPYLGYLFYSNRIYSETSKSGHLLWKFVDNNPIFWMVWLFFFLFSFIYTENWRGFVFASITLIISWINYTNDNTIGSMWCWLINSMMIYYAVYLLLVLPFCEKKSIC